MARPKKGTTFWDRVWPLTDKSSGCWIFNGAKDSCGYGRIWRDKVLVRVHREVYRTFCGEIPDGHNICHHCDNPACINPDHLFAGTQDDNVRDMLSKGRWSPNWNNQHRPNGKLCRIDVAFIKKYIADGEKRKDLAAHFGVHRKMIDAIARGESWASIKAAP